MMRNVAIGAVVGFAVTVLVLALGTRAPPAAQPAPAQELAPIDTRRLSRPALEQVELKPASAAAQRLFGAMQRDAGP